MKDLNLTRFRKSDSSPRLLGQENVLFETLDLGPFRVANWKLGFQGSGERDPSVLWWLVS